MYEKHFGLTGKPFGIVPNPQTLFLSKNHANALTYLEYGLTERVGFILLTGEIGTGKTTLVRHMLSRMESQMDVAVIFNTGFSSDQLFRLILNEFEVPCNVVEKEKHLELLYQFLIDRYAKNRHVLLIIDEAQNLSADSLEDIRMLSNLQTDDKILLQMMLVGQPELKATLQRPEMRQLAQRIAVNYHLVSLNEDQTRQYIAYRVASTGGKPDLFSPDAVSLIYEKSGGTPRTINLLCDSALVYGYADDLKRIDRAVIEQVLMDETCLAVVEQSPEPAAPIGSAPSAVSDEIRERMAVVEASVDDLKHRHSDLYREVKYELLFKYQDLLITERKRYDQLMAKYTHLLQKIRTSNGNGKEAGAEWEGKNRQEASPVDLDRGWRGKIGRAFKG
ncbi:MAG: AAA family ATPase [Desulfosarcina sp.]